MITSASTYLTGVSDISGEIMRLAISSVGLQNKNAHLQIASQASMFLSLLSQGNHKISLKKFYKFNTFGINEKPCQQWILAQFIKCNLNLKLWRNVLGKLKICNTHQL